MTIPNSAGRYYINNLGMARAFMVGLMSISKDALTVRGIEVDLTQGTS